MKGSASMEINIRPASQADKEEAPRERRERRDLFLPRAPALPQMNSIHRADSTIRLCEEKRHLEARDSSLQTLLRAVRGAGRKIVLLR